jgi:hypothetical protein
MLRNLLLLSLAAVSGAACLPLDARTLVDVDVVDRDTGQWLPEYTHRGRLYVPGEPGHRYAVRLTNQTGERVLVVLSVDGVNAVTGQTASPSQAGYVLAPWESAEIAGWRKSLDDVAQFYFTDLPDSYAARTGRPDNVGVIGIAVFRERAYAAPYPMPGPPVADAQGARSDAKSANAPAPAARESSAQADSAYGGIAEQRQRIGTGHGAREWAPVGRTDFVRASSRPAQVVQLRYDAPEALAALGVLPRPHWQYPHGDEPRAFPNGFVADPPGW